MFSIIYIKIIGFEWPHFVKIYFHGWTEFCKSVLSLDASKVCLLIYENLVENVIKELKPCVEFLGYKIDRHLAECIKLDKEGSYHRSPMSEEDLNYVFNKPFTIEEQNIYRNVSQLNIRALKKHSVNHRLEI